MELLILAAGRGSRLGTLTNLIPKGLLKIQERSLIERQIDVVENELFIDKVSIAVGYKSEKFDQLKNINKILIANWNKFNMIGTFLNVVEQNQINMSKDILITYGDILLKDGFFSNCKFKDTHDILLPIIEDWKKQWEGRYDNPLSDLETLKYDKNNKLLEIGRRPRNFDEIMGQFTGVVFIPSHKIEDFIICCKKVYALNINADMTFLLSFMLSKKINIDVSLVPNSKWYEIDTLKDLEYAIRNQDE